MAVVNGRAVDDGIGFGQLNLLDHLPGLDIVTEEGAQVGIADPERISFPTDAVRAIGGHGPGRLNFPGLRIHDIQRPRRRNREVQEAPAVLDTMGPGPTKSVLRIERDLSVRKSRGASPARTGVSTGGGSRCRRSPSSTTSRRGRRRGALIFRICRL